MLFPSLPAISSLQVVLDFDPKRFAAPGFALLEATKLAADGEVVLFDSAPLTGVSLVRDCLRDMALSGCRPRFHDCPHFQRLIPPRRINDKTVGAHRTCFTSRTSTATATHSACLRSVLKSTGISPEYSVSGGVMWTPPCLRLRHAQ